MWLTVVSWVVSIPPLRRSKNQIELDTDEDYSQQKSDLFLVSIKQPEAIIPLFVDASLVPRCVFANRYPRSQRRHRQFSGGVPLTPTHYLFVSRLISTHVRHVIAPSIHVVVSLTDTPGFQADACVDCLLLPLIVCQKIVTFVTGLLSFAGDLRNTPGQLLTIVISQRKE